MSLLSDGLTGLTHAAPLFLVAAGLTLIFRATRLLDFGQAGIAALAATLVTRLPLDPAVALLVIPATAAVLGAALDLFLFRRLDRAPLLSRLLVTLGLFLLFDAAAHLLATGPAAQIPAWLQPKLAVGTIVIPTMTLALIAVAPIAFGLLLLLPRNTSGPWRRTPIVALAAALSALAGALPLHAAAIPACGLDLLSDALLVLLLGGLGSLPGAFIAAVLIALIEALTADLFPQAAQILPLIATAAVLLIRPNGLLGHAVPSPTQPGLLIRPTPRSAKYFFAAALFLALAGPLLGAPAGLLASAAIAILFAASLHVFIGPGGLPALGHAAFLGVGAYAAALFIQNARATTDLPLLAAALIIGLLTAGIAALLIGTIIARLSATATAMLTLVVAYLAWTAAAQLGPIPAITPMSWSNLPWTPPIWLPPAVSVWLTLALCLSVTLLLRRLLYAPFGYALRAARDNPVRAAAIGLPIPLLRLIAFTLAGTTAGLAGALTVIATDTIRGPTLDRSAEALLMLSLGGLQTIAAPIVGAVTYTGIADALPASPLWPLLLGPALIAVTLLLPNGIAGTSIAVWRRAE